jgi:hypothetical protein
MDAENSRENEIVDFFWALSVVILKKVQKFYRRIVNQVKEI